MYSSFLFSFPKSFYSIYFLETTLSLLNRLHNPIHLINYLTSFSTYPYFDIFYLSNYKRAQSFLFSKVNNNALIYIQISLFQETAYNLFFRFCFSKTQCHQFNQLFSCNFSNSCFMNQICLYIICNNFRYSNYFG